MIEFSFTKEIEDRLLAPLPVTWVAIEKVLIASLRGIVGGLLILPLGELILTPLMFTGATFYPWEALDSLRWFQVITLANPMTYVSEGLRGALTGAPHLAAGWVVLGLIASVGVFGILGVRGFVRCAVD